MKMSVARLAGFGLVLIFRIIFEGFIYNLLILHKMLDVDIQQRFSADRSHA